MNDNTIFPEKQRIVGRADVCLAEKMDENRLEQGALLRGNQRGNQ
jgi:hypothetical protein